MRASFKNTIIYIGLFICLFLIGTVLLVLSFRTRLFSGIDILFYRGIALIVFYGLLISVLLSVLRRSFFSDIFMPRDVLMLFIVFCSIHMVFFTHVPVTAERSISVFMLGTMSDRNEQTFLEDEMEDYFIERYVKDFGAFEKRFHEQLETGTIEEVAPGDYRITKSGKKLMKLYETVADWYQIDDRMIHPDRERDS